MTSRLTLVTPLAAMVLVTAGSPAQHQQAPLQQAGGQQAGLAATGQAVPDNLATAALRRVARLQPGREPRPDAPVAMSINWVAAAEDALLQARQLRRFDTVSAVTQGNLPFARPTNPEAAGVVATRLPVLIPDTAALAVSNDARTLLFPQQDFYTLSVIAPGLVVEVFGTRLAHAHASDPLSTRRLNATNADGYRISETEYGRELSFNRYGAAYSITVECDRPTGDPRCSSDAYIRNLADSLIIAAGTPDAGGQ
ncbi:hypothetical protein [Maricaulis sp.]|uniref:hypothetical protein n=1 Tax=Maricaulis sp. TaxID=1486257 RepID=UPI002B2719CB|nr:hypothetical protein [Maricaulis sp.]